MAEGQGRSSNQGVKLLYIRDYLHKYTNKEHPKSAKDIIEYLASKGIKAERKTIYNDILRLQMDFQAPKVLAPVHAVFSMALFARSVHREFGLKEADEQCAPLELKSLYSTK